jgi:CRISPR-associated protein Cmr5
MSNGKSNPKSTSHSDKEIVKPVLLAKPTISSSEIKIPQSPSIATNQDSQVQDQDLNIDKFSSNPRDLDRNRAKDAWKKIIEVKGKNYEGKYSSRVRDLPTMIQVNGLAQTLAFLKAKAKEHDPKSRQEHLIKLFEHVSEWVCSQLLWGKGNLLERIIETSDTQNYRQATSEVMAYAQWLKRFAEAELKSEENQSK